MSCTPCKVAFVRMAAFLEMVKDILPPREKEEARRVAGLLGVVGAELVEREIEKLRTEQSNIHV